MTNAETCTIGQVGETLVSDHCIFALKISTCDFQTLPFLIKLYQSHNKVQSSVSSSANLLVSCTTLEPNCPLIFQGELCFYGIH